MIKLNIDTPMINPTTGKPVRIVSMATASELGIQTTLEMEQRVEDFPISVLSNVITQLFDVIPLPSTSLFSIYSEVVTDIRKAKQKGDSTIEISKDSLQKFKSIFADKPPQEPRNNRNVAFVLECIDFALAKLVTEPLKIPEN